MLTKSCKDWLGVAMQLITSAKMNVSSIASAIRNVLRGFKCRIIGLFTTSRPSLPETVRVVAMSRDMLCFDENGNVVASKNGATGTVIHILPTGDIQDDIRQNISFFGTQAYTNPDYPHLLHRHRQKKRFKGYGLKKVAKIIEMQLNGEMGEL